MTRMQINGATQIKTASITAAILAASVLAPFARLDGTTPYTAPLNLGGFKASNMATPTVATDGANKGYVDSALGAYIKLDGSVAFTGSINAGSQKLINLATPTAATDGANKGYVDSALGAYAKLDGSNPFTGNVSLGGFKISNLAAPTADTDAATKNYVDTAVLGFSTKGTARALIASNVALTGIPAAGVADGITLAAGNIVLLTAQTTGSQNGLWVVAAGAWARPANYAPASVQQNDAFLFISEGTTYADSGWISVTDGAITVDTTTTVWQQFTGGSGIIASGVLNKAGNTLSVNIGDGLENSASFLRVKLNGATLDRTAGGIRLAPLAAAQFYLGQGAGTDLAPVTMSGDATMAATGVVTVAATVTTAARQLTNVTPSGTVDGTNAAFTLSNVYQNTLLVFQNGLLQEPGAGNDYVLGGSNAAATLTFAAAPLVGDKIRVAYTATV